QCVQLFVVHIDHHASHNDRSRLPVQTQTPLDSRTPLRLIPHWTTLSIAVAIKILYSYSLVLQYGIKPNTEHLSIVKGSKNHEKSAGLIVGHCNFWPCSNRCAVY